MKNAMSTNMRQANMKNSEDLSSKVPASATNMTMTLPKAVVRSQKAWTTDFILWGAWLYANSIPVMLNMISPCKSRI